MLTGRMQPLVPHEPVRAREPTRIANYAREEGTYFLPASEGLAGNKISPVFFRVYNIAIRDINGEYRHNLRGAQ